MANIQLPKPSRLPVKQSDYFFNLRLTYDELLTFEDIPVEASQTRSARWTNSTIQAAIQSMANPQIPMSYLVELSSNDDLYQQFMPPNKVLSVDMYRKYCPKTTHLCGFLRKQNLMLQGFNQSWQSLPFRPYGGLSTWIYVISGELEIYLIPATKLNLLRYSISRDFSSSELDSFKMSSDTNLQLLDENTFLFIPAGYIILVKATKNTFILKSNYLDETCLVQQMVLFEFDTSQDGSLQSAWNRDIRSLYWFFAANIMADGSRNNLLNFDAETLGVLRKLLTSWSQQDGLEKEQYVPNGLRSKTLLKSLKDHLYKRSKRARKLQCEKELSSSSNNDMVDD